MITLRRKLLNKELTRVSSEARGHVLDIGGKKGYHKGNYNPPYEKAQGWKFLNPDPRTNPDYLGTLSQTKLEDQTFDQVYLIEVLEYLKNPLEDLQHIQRILKPGGVLYLSVPLLFPLHGDEEKDRFRWTTVALKDALSETGFEDIQITCLGSVFTVIHDLLYVALSYGSPKYPGGSLRKFFWRTLGLTQPLFEILDALFENRKRFITTGYFVRCTKT